VTLSPEQVELLDRGLIGRLGFTAADGSPRVVPIWYVHRGVDLLMTTGARSYKTRRLRADPRAAFEVSTPERPYKELEARGRVTVEPLEGDRKLEVRRRIARRYISEPDAERYAALPYEVVLLRFRPEQVRYFDHARSRR
jgi:PPOX class probable F420-dependent enzyme